MFLLSLLLLASLHTVAASLFLQASPCFWWRPYCVGGPVAALIPAVACIPAVVRTVMILLSFLMLLVASVTVIACVTAVACIQTVAGILAVAGVLLSSWWFPVAGLSAIADVPVVTNGDVCIPVVPFKHAVAGGPAVTGLPAVEGVFALASVPANPGVHILAGGFAYWIVEWDVLDYLDYQTMAIGL
jgi:hypothetical protein